MQVLWEDSETQLVGRLSILETSEREARVFVFHLDELLEQYKSDYQMRIAVNLVHDLLRNFDGIIGVSADGSITVLCEEVTDPLQNKLIFQLRYLYMDDPLAYTDDGEENSDFCTVYDVQKDIKACRDYLNRRMMYATRGKEAGLGKSRYNESRNDNLQFNPSRLVSLEKKLKQIDLTEAFRNQPVCAVVSMTEAKPVFKELYINMKHLRELLNADFDILSNKWLFKYVTTLLDARVMQTLSHNREHFLRTPVSININVESLLSDAFTSFNAQLPDSFKIGIVYEIDVVDVFADIKAFHFARQRVQNAGYRICIDGLTPDSFLHIQRTYLQADLLKMQWNADTINDLKQDDNTLLRQAIATNGANRTILCRCDTEQAIRYGKKLGISLYQGRFIDRIVDPIATIAN